MTPRARPDRLSCCTQESDLGNSCVINSIVSLPSLWHRSNLMEFNVLECRSEMAQSNAQTAVSEILGFSPRSTASSRPPLGIEAVVASRSSSQILAALKESMCGRRARKRNASGWGCKPVFKHTFAKRSTGLTSVVTTGSREDGRVRFRDHGRWNSGERTSGRPRAVREQFSSSRSMSSNSARAL